MRVLCTESGGAGKEAGSTKKKKKKLKSKSKKGTSGATVTIASSIAVASSDFADAKTSSDKVGGGYKILYHTKYSSVCIFLEGEYD